MLNLNRLFYVYNSKYFCIYIMPQPRSENVYMQESLWETIEEDN